MESVIAQALGLGLIAGVSPSPLTLYVLGLATTRHTSRPVILALLGGAVFDLMLVAMGLVFALSLTEHRDWVAVLYVAGALHLGRLGIRAWRGKKTASGEIAFPKGAIFPTAFGIQALNPNPYLFWLGVGCPLLATLIAKTQRPLALLFVFGFLTTTYGIKALMAMSTRLAGEARVSKILRPSCAVGLMGFAVYYLFEGIKPMF